MIDYHVYPSGNKVIKAFIANNIVFYDKSGDLIIFLDDKSADIVKKVKITWRIQKTTVRMARKLRCQLMMIIPNSVLFAQHCKWYS